MVIMTMKDKFYGVPIYNTRYYTKYFICMITYILCYILSR